MHYSDKNLQALIDGMSAQWQRERAETQMTLGKLIARLKEMPDGAIIEGISEPHSYRGYYSDLAFEPREEVITAAELLKLCKDAMGRVFEGYKGGDFVMGALTPVWVAFYGCTGKKLMAVEDDGQLNVKSDED